jgi:hypothetical protein
MADTLVDRGLGVMVAVIVIGAVAIPTVGQTLVLDTQSVNNDEYTPSDSLPSTFQVNPYEDGIVQDSETLYLDKSGDDSNLIELTKGDDYNVSSYEDGKFTLKAGGTESQNYNTSNGDQIEASYNYKPTGYIGGTAGTILGFIDLALALALFVGAIALVR